MRTIELNNIEINPKTAKDNKLTKENTDVNSLIEPVINRLATLNPLWVFRGINVEHRGGDRFALSGFEVILDGEVLGIIRKQWHGSKNVIEISNDRISKNMLRRNGYRTQDADKAILKAKKMFAKQNSSERIEKALGTAKQVIGNQVYERNSIIRDAKSYVRQRAEKYVMEEGYQLFLEFVKTTYTQSDLSKFYVNMEKGKEAAVEMLTIEKVRDQLGTDSSALVIKDGGNYVVKTGNDVQIYDDNTLPENLRGKLGMLKLVEKEHFISNVGCRVSDEIFVLIVEPNIVSQ
mgnify:CR=1 FL=1